MSEELVLTKSDRTIGNIVVCVHCTCAIWWLIVQASSTADIEHAATCMLTHMHNEHGWDTAATDDVMQ